MLIICFLYFTRLYSYICI